MKYTFATFLIVLCLTAARPMLAATIAPLDSSPDQVGSALQQTMIWAAPDTKLNSAFVAFRKQFSLAEMPTAAQLNLFADVRYMIWINGKYVLRGPARFDPKGPEYDTDDVKQFLQSGNNQIVVLVMANQSNGKMMHHVPGLTARLDITGSKGDRTVVNTDSSWKCSDNTRYRSPHVDWGNEMDVIDSTVEDGDWTQLNYDDSRWAHASPIVGTQWGPLSARRIPLLRDTPLDVRLGDKEFPVTLTAGQHVNFKLERLVQAYTMIDFEADPGSRFDLSYAGITYKAKPGRQVFLSSDTHGFSSGTIKVLAGKITIHSFKPVERIYPFDCAGSFTSNDPLLNKLWNMCSRSLQVMSEDSYVDCSDRERTEWMDDTPPCWDITKTAMVGPGDEGKQVFSDPRLLRELLRRTALSLQPEGWVKAHTCSDRFDIHAKMEDRACDWVQGARLYFDCTANAEPIREIWPALVAQMNYFLSNRTSRGLVFGREWVMWDNPMGYETSEGTGLNAFVCKALVDAAYLAKAIGKTQDADRFDQAAKDLSTAMNKVLWDDKNGTYFSGYDTPQAELPPGVKKGKIGLQPDWVLRPKPPTGPDNHIDATVFSTLIALDQEIVPDDRRDRVTKYLLAQPEPNTRIMFYYYYWKQLYAQNSVELDTKILASMRTRWKPMADADWQTSWEDFEVGSRAHCYGMFPGYFLSAYVLGVREDGPPTDKRVLINPHLGDLTDAHGTVVTPTGLVTVSWKSSGGQLAFSFNTPEGVKPTLKLSSYQSKATLTLDGQPIKLGSDQSTFIVSTSPGAHAGTLTFPKPN